MPRPGYKRSQVTGEIFLNLLVGHLKREKLGCFAKTIFYFLEADQHSSCSVIIKADKAVNFGDGEGMQVPCKLRISGREKFVNILKKELEHLEK